jgi:hypothetical protein
MQGALTSCQAYMEGQIRRLKEPEARGELTNCRVHKEGQDKTLEEIERTRGTHRLVECMGRVKSGYRVLEGHSHPVEHTRGVKSGY